jgi:hypothetical protein
LVGFLLVFSLAYVVIILHYMKMTKITFHKGEGRAREVTILFALYIIIMLRSLWLQNNIIIFLFLSFFACQTPRRGVNLVTVLLLLLLLYRTVGIFLVIVIV